MWINNMSKGVFFAPEGSYIFIKYYTSKINTFNSVNSNFKSGRSGKRPKELIKADGKFEHFEPDYNIRKLE